MGMEEFRVELISKIILACAVLDNLCILLGDEWEEDNANGDPDQNKNNDDIIRH